MGFLNVNCPNCGSENAYHNGVEFECPECDHIWGALDEDDFDEEDDHEL